MRKAFLVLLALSIGFNSHAKHKKHKKQQKSGSGIVSVHMHRPGCYGRCPTYMIDINAAGLVTYSAMRFNADTGEFTKNAGTKKAEEIFNQIITTRIDTCKDEYKAPNTDLPGMILTITYKNSVKTINNANYGPAVLRLLAEKMDAIVGGKTDKTWKKVKEYK